MHHISFLLILAGSCSAGLAGDDTFLEKAEKFARDAQSAFSADPPFEAGQTNLPHPSYSYDHDQAWPEWESLKHEVESKNSHAVEAAKAQITHATRSVDDEEDEDDYEAYRAAFLRRGINSNFKRDVIPIEEVPVDEEDYEGEDD